MVCISVGKIQQKIYYLLQLFIVLCIIIKINMAHIIKHITVECTASYNNFGENTDHINK